MTLRRDEDHHAWGLGKSDELGERLARQSPAVLVNAQADARLSGPLSSAEVSVKTSTQPGEPNAEISAATSNLLRT